MAQKTKLLFEELSEAIIGAFYVVYNALGYGFLELVYANALSLELRTRGFRVEREVGVEVQYLGQPVGRYRIDLVVDRSIVVEIKSGAATTDADRKQLFNYLKASRLSVGLLLHFGPKPAFKRVVLEERSASSASSA